MSRTPYFIDARHAFFFQIFISLIPRYILQSIASSVCNWQHFFFLFGTENNKAFNNPWHLSQWNMIWTLCQPFSFQIVFNSYCLTFIFVLLCPPSVFSSLCPAPNSNYPPGRIHSFLQFSFYPEIIIKPTCFFRSTWPLTPQYVKSFLKVSSYLKCLVTQASIIILFSTFHLLSHFFSLTLSHN